jgi:hypothetical protein
MANITLGVGRYDKYDPISGGFRAKLAANTTAAATPIGVGLNANGEVVAGAGVTGVLGVLSLTKNKLAGDVIDVMTAGEMVDIAGMTAGDVITANTTTGVLSDTAASATQTPVGFTVEATRLVVRRAAQPFIGT